MPRLKSKSTDALWAEHFRAAIALKGRAPEGEGWLTRKEFCERCNMCRGRAHIYLRTQLESGRMESFRGSVMNNDKGILVPQVWYRPKN